MTVYRAKSARYADLFDILYVLCGADGSLSKCHSVEDTPSGITVMYDREGSVIGAEVSDFSERFVVPSTIKVDAKRPFELRIDNIDNAPNLISVAAV